MSICKNDNVIILSGKYRGKIGRVIGVDLKKNRYKVKDINLCTSFKKTTEEEVGGIFKEEGWINRSKIAFWNGSSILRSDKLKKLKKSYKKEKFTGNFLEKRSSSIEKQNQEENNE